MANDNSASCSHKPQYNKGGNAGVEGTLYQINLLTIFLLNGLKISQEWYLSTENEAAGKFDDLVFESPEGDIFLQAKHKKNKKKKIGYEDLLSTNSKNDDFSLPKYFFSYVEIRDNFNIKNLIICTNNDLRVDANLKQHIKKHTLLEDDLLYFQGANSTIYTFNETILITLKQNIETYYDENLQIKSIPRDVISDDNIKKFLKCLQFLANYPSKGNLDAAVEKIISETELSKNLDSKMVYNFFYKKMQDWFKQDKGVYFTKAHAKAFFCEIHSNEYCNTLKNHSIHFDNNDLPVGDSNKKVWHIVPQEHYIVNLLKFYHTLQKRNEKEFLLIAPDYSDDIRELIIDAFQIPLYVYLIIVCLHDLNDFFTEEICVKIKELLEGFKYKKLILVSAENHKLAEYFKETDIYEMIEEDIEFRHLNNESKKKILIKKNVLFQGDETCLSKLLSVSNEEDLSEFIDSETLARFVTNEKITVGAKVEALSEDIKNYYVHRTFNINSRVVSEEAMWDLNAVPGKMVLISDSPGMGKTTILTYLAEKIKKNYPNLWVVKLNINNYTNVLFEFLEAGRQRITIPQLLDSQELTRLQTAFEKKLFSLPGRVLIMVDGVDEISPDYKDIAVNLIRHCMENPSFVKIYVSTRPHLLEELVKKFNVEAMTLSLFSKQNQWDFLTKYWKKQLGLKKSLQTKNCQAYAKQLIREMSDWINERGEDMLAAVPLQTRMIAEVFQAKGNIDIDLGDWQGCREFLTSQELHPRLPQKINLVKLYQLFLAKKKQIFIQDKGKSTGNVIAIEGLKKVYDECQLYHQLLALKYVLRERDAELMNYYRCLRERNPEGKNAVKLGIVQQIDGRYSFMHRTFAEFYVAECFVLELQCGYQNRPFQDFFVDDILDLFEYTVIRSFLDNFLGEQTLPEEVFKAYSSLDYTERLYNGDNTFLHTLTKEGCHNLVGFFLKCLSQTENFTDIDRIRDAFGRTLLHYACQGYANMAELLVRNGASVNVEDCDGDVPLHDAISRDRREVAALLLDTGANVNAQCRNERTPLHAAIEESNLEMVELLLANGSDPNVADEDGNAALHEAAQRWDPNIIKVLVNNGADVHSRNQEECIPLHVACKFSNLEVVKELVENNSKVNDQNREGSTALHMTARWGHIDTFKYLVDNGADVTITDRNGRVALHYAAHPLGCEVIDFLLGMCDINVVDGRGNTALHLAAEWGYLNVVKFLVERGASVNARDEMGRAPLRAAVGRHRLDIMEYLIDVGVEVNAIDDYGRPIVHLRYISLDAMKYLIGKGVAINVRDDEGMTALHYAVGHNSKDTIDYVKILVEAGADVNIADNQGRTALHHASERDDLGVVQYLFDNGADPNTADCNKRTLLHVAAKRGDAILSRILLNTNVNINARDCEGRTAFHQVCSKPGGDTPDLVEAFVSMGADINAVDNRSRTPLHDAVASGASIVALLIRLGAKADARDANGASPLLFATMKPSTDDVRLLMENGADANARDSSGSTVLFAAVDWGDMDILCALVDSGADVNTTNREGRTALHLCARWNRLDKLRYLVGSGADVDAPDADGSTPLHEVRTLEAVELLTACGANVNARNGAGQTPLHAAAQRECLYQYEYGRLVEIMRLLLAKGASVNSRDARGRTALHAAAEAGRVATARPLVEGGADVGVADEEGRTALDLAISKERVDVISFLEGRGENA